MKRAELSVADVAQRLSVQRKTVRDWLADAEPSDRNFKKLVKLFPELAEFGDRS